MADRGSHICSEREILLGLVAVTVRYLLINHTPAETLRFLDG